MLQDPIRIILNFSKAKFVQKLVSSNFKSKWSGMKSWDFCCFTKVYSVLVKLWYNLLPISGFRYYSRNQHIGDIVFFPWPSRNRSQIERYRTVIQLKLRLKTLKNVGRYRTPRHARVTVFERSVTAWRRDDEGTKRDG